VPRELPQEFTYVSDEHLLIWRPSGTLDEATVDRAVRCIGDLERASEQPFHRYTDATALDAVELNFRYVFHVALHRRAAYAGKPKVKSAFVVNRADVAHYVRLHEVFTQRSGLNVRIFEEADEAAKYLGVELALLSPPAKR